MSGRVGFAADLVRARVDSLRRAADEVFAGRTRTASSSGVAELGGIDAAFSDVGAAVVILGENSGEALTRAGDNLADALASMIAVEQDIVQIIARAIGALA